MVSPASQARKNTLVPQKKRAIIFRLCHDPTLVKPPI
jgi:hypothetical protein